MEEIHRARYGERAQSFHAPSECHSASVTLCSPNGRSLNLVLLAFKEASLHRHD